MIDSVHAVDNLSDQTGHAIWQKRIFFILLHENKASFIWLAVCRKYSETLTLNSIRCIKYTVCELNDWFRLFCMSMFNSSVNQACDKMMINSPRTSGSRKTCAKIKTINIRKDAITAKTV